MCVLFISTIAYNPSDLPVVMIRMDDVTQGWCEHATKAVISAVLGTDTPLSLGLIAAELNADKNFSEYLYEISKNDLIDVTSHSFEHQSFDDKNLSWQENDLYRAQELISDVTQKTPHAFLVPYSEFDSNTIQAVADNEDLFVFSAQCVWNLQYENTKLYCPDPLDVVAPNTIVNGVHMLSAGAVLGDVTAFTDFFAPASFTDCVGWIEAQIANQGFSVLMLHPVQFTTDKTCLNIVQEKLDVLVELIEYGKSRWQFMSLTDGAKYFTQS